MKKLFYSLLVMSIVTASCSKSLQEPIATTSPITPETTVSEPLAATASIGYKDYLIKKGNHYCEQTQIKFITATTIKAKVMFDSSAIYTSVLGENQGDINKLLGFSDCGTDHQQNSARLGWSWNGEKVVIYAYAYVNGVRISKPLGTVKLNEQFSCSICAVKENFQFTAGAYTDSIPRHCSDYKGFRYKLYPYFGGDEVAPHDVHIAIAEE